MIDEITHTKIKTIYSLLDDIKSKTGLHDIRGHHINLGSVSLICFI